MLGLHEVSYLQSTPLFLFNYWKFGKFFLRIIVIIS